MNRSHLDTLGGILLAAASLVACAGSPPGFTPPTTGTPAQIKTAQDVQWACFGMQGVMTEYATLAPVFKVQPGSNGDLAIKSAQALLTTSCAPGSTIDPNSVASIYANVMSVTGQVVAIVVAAGASPAVPKPSS